MCVVGGHESSTGIGGSTPIVHAPTLTPVTPLMNSRERRSSGKIEMGTYERRTQLKEIWIITSQKCKPKR